MSVTAIIVTRGDADLIWIRNSFPRDWQILIWDNGAEECREWTQDQGMWVPSFRWDAVDLSVYGRYAAIQHASHDLIYVQDDDCIVSDPRAIVRTWLAGANHTVDGPVLDGAATWGRAEHPRGRDVVVCNMPPEFRHDFYSEHALVGFGAAFHRDAPERAFGKFNLAFYNGFFAEDGSADYDFYRRTCDIVFTALTPRVLVDVPKTNLWWAEDESRMYRQPSHGEERARMLELVKQVRDG